MKRHFKFFCFGVLALFAAQQAMAQGTAEVNVTVTGTGATGSVLSPVAPPVPEPDFKKISTAVSTTVSTVSTAVSTVSTAASTAISTGIDRSENRANIVVDTDARTARGTRRTPLMPSETNDRGNGRWQFIINIVINITINTIWVDPVVAVGYDYAVEHGPAITGVELPTMGDNIYDLLTYDDQSGQYVDSGVDIEGGVLYKFDAPTKKFAIRGIETSAGLDPASETAFPTGLRFERTGKAVLSMTSVAAETK